MRFFKIEIIDQPSEHKTGFMTSPWPRWSVSLSFRRRPFGVWIRFGRIAWRYNW